jgi:manganese transport protein
VETLPGFGDVAKGIIRMFQEEKIDILVVGGHGHRGMSDLVFGSTITPM